MIFLTVGSHEPFDRLIRAVDDFAATRPDLTFYGQITDRSAHRPAHFDWVENLSPADYKATCARATCFVAHAGMGSIITALQLSRPIVIMPRRGHLNETRNDHQYATAQKFRDKPGIFLAEDESALPDAITAALASTDAASDSLTPYAQDSLIGFLRGAALGTDAGQ